MKNRLLLKIYLIVIFHTVDCGLIELEKAKLFYKEQKQEEAFQIFMDALPQETPSLVETPLIAHELYLEALELYLTTKGDKLYTGSQELLTRYSSIVEQHPDYYELRFVIAAAYANLGDYSHFFDQFYAAFVQLPNHYLAHKTLAIISVKLFERLPPGEEKELRRKQVLAHLNDAVNLYPSDTALYRLMILYAPKEQRATFVAESLNKIIQGNTMIPRADLDFYVQQALTLDDTDLIQCFIDKASEWYHFSRVLTAAKQQLQHQLQKKSLQRSYYD